MSDRRAMRALLLAAGLVGLAGAAVADDAPPPIRQFDVPTTEMLGRAIYDQDQMAWKAGDVLTAQYTQDELVAAKVRGWIVTTSASENTVRIVDIGADGPEIFCDVTFSPEQSRSCVTPHDRTLAGDELAQYTARTTALTSIVRRCAENYNSVVLKDPQGDGWLVWALAATTVPGAVMYGGHYRFTISKDGTTIQQRDALSRSCFSSPPPDKSQGELVALFYNQIVANTPLETAVFLSLQHKLPIYVGTPDNRIWKVDGDKIIADVKLPTDKPKPTL